MTNIFNIIIAVYEFIAFKIYNPVLEEVGLGLYSPLYYFVLGT